MEQNMLSNNDGTIEEQNKKHKKKTTTNRIEAKRKPENHAKCCKHMKSFDAFAMIESLFS